MTDRGTPEHGSVGMAGNAPSDEQPDRGAWEAESTAAVRAFADSGGSALSAGDVARLDEVAPGGTAGAGGSTLGDAIGGAGTAGTYRTAETATGTPRDTGASPTTTDAGDGGEAD